MATIRSYVKKDTFSKYWKEILIGLFVLYHVFFKNSFFKDVINSEDAPLPGTVLNNDLPVSNVTITKSNAVSMANVIYEATANYTQMGFPATDEDAIYGVLNKLKTQDDFNLVYKTFGLRPYSKDFGTASGIVNKPLNMIEILSYELNNSEKRYIRDNYPHLTIF